MKRLSAMTFALFIISTATVSAQDLKFDDYRKFLMNGSGAKGTKKMAIQTTCVTASGQTTRIGETAYDLCLNEVRNQIDQKSMTGQKDATNPVAVPSTSTTIHIGN